MKLLSLFALRFCQNGKSNDRATCYCPRDCLLFFRRRLLRRPRVYKRQVDERALEELPDAWQRQRKRPTAGGRQARTISRSLFAFVHQPQDRFTRADHRYSFQKRRVVSAVEAKCQYLGLLPTWS